MIKGRGETEGNEKRRIGSPGRKNTESMNKGKNEGKGKGNRERGRQKD